MVRGARGLLQRQEHPSAGDALSDGECWEQILLVAGSQVPGLLVAAGEGVDRL